MNQSEKINELAAALSPALGRLRNPKPDAHGQVRAAKYKYVSLAKLTQQIRDVFKDVGLAVTQETVSDGPSLGVVTRIVHLSGQWLEYGPLMFHVQGGPQDAGSAITYARRYALAAAVGVAADEDDDGAAASNRPDSTQARASGNQGGEVSVSPPSPSDPSAGTPADATGAGDNAFGEGAASSAPTVEEVQALYGGIAHLLRAARQQWDVKTKDDLTPVMLTELKRVKAA